MGIFDILFGNKNKKDAGGGKNENQTPNKHKPPPQKTEGAPGPPQQGEKQK